MTTFDIIRVKYKMILQDHAAPCQVWQHQLNGLLRQPSQDSSHRKSLAPEGRASLWNLETILLEDAEASCAAETYRNLLNVFRFLRNA